MIAEEIHREVAADKAYQNAMKTATKQQLSWSLSEL
jgi:hypothetical protein